MNNTTKTKKVGFPETTAPAGESFTLNPAVAYINKVRMLSRNRCKCGGKLYVTGGMVLLTYPAKYTVKCDCCGCTQTVSETDLIYETEYTRDLDPKTTTKPISINGDSIGIATLNISESNNKCNHSFDVKLINGNYITYCTKCGKIGDSSQAPMPNFTNTPGIINHLDTIPCIDPLRFTCTVDGDLAATSITNLDEAKKVTARASNTIGVIDKIYAGSTINAK